MLIHSVGFGVVFVLSYTITPVYLINDSHKGIAIITTGFEAVLMVFGPLLQVLLDSLIT